MNQIKMPTNKDWDKHWKKPESKKEDNPSWSKRRIIQAINPYVKKGIKVLDAGCGSGFFSKYFCENEMVTTAVDYSDIAIEKTRKLTSDEVKVFNCDLTTQNLPDVIEDRFSLIFSDGLLEHFSGKEQDKILNNFSKLLCKGGVLATFVPNRWSPWEIIRPFFMPGIDETPFVLRTLVSVHKRNGFDIVSCGGINTFPFRFSPDKVIGSFFGMLLYTIAKKND